MRRGGNLRNRMIRLHVRFGSELCVIPVMHGKRTQTHTHRKNQNDLHCMITSRLSPFMWEIGGSISHRPITQATVTHIPPLDPHSDQLSEIPGSRHVGFFLQCQIGIHDTSPSVQRSGRTTCPLVINSRPWGVK